MIFKNKKSEVIEFVDPYRVTTEGHKHEELPEEVNEPKYLGSILCKHESM